MTIFRTLTFLVSLSFFAIAGFSPCPTSAFTGKEKIPELKFDTKLTEAEFEAHSKLIEETPQDDKDYAFSIRIPTNWVKVGAEEDKGLLGTDLFTQLARFETSPRIEEKSILRVRSISLEGLIAANDWLIGYMLEMGFSLEGLHTPSERRVETQYTLFSQNEPMATRAVAEISGTKMILAEYMVHQNNYEKEKDEQILAMKSFHLTSPNPKPSVEIKTASFIDIAKFDYPGTWLLYAPNITTIDRMEASVINVRGGQYKKKVDRNVSFDNIKLDGRIDVTLIAKTTGATFASEIKIIKDSLNEKKLILGDLLEVPQPLTLHSDILVQNSNVYQINSMDKELAGYEYWITLLESKSRIYKIRMLTIGRSENFVVWAQNVETYKTLLRSLGPAGIIE